MRKPASPRCPARIVVAPDSFKGTLSARRAAAAIAAGLQRGWPGVQCLEVPMADGGEGFSEAVVDATGMRWVRAHVHDPLGRPRFARYGWDPRRRFAVMELAAASGLTLLQPGERDPLRTSTVGTGELLRDALDRGARHILLGIGGSATNDGGTGLAAALGWRFLDRAGRPLPPGGGALRRLAHIDGSQADPRLRHVRLEVACDVTNPLCGPDGASTVYGPQKGATPSDVRRLEAALAHLAATLPRARGAALARRPGAGAAGGAGFGLMAFCDARLRRGVVCVADAVGLSQRMRGCSLAVTGEGRIDGQTARGKTPAGVAAVARRLGIPTIAIGGCLGPGVEAVRRAGILAVFEVGAGPDPAHLARDAARRLARRAEEVGRLLAAGAVLRC